MEEYQQRVVGTGADQGLVAVSPAASTGVAIADRIAARQNSLDLVIERLHKVVAHKRFQYGDSR